MAKRQYARVAPEVLRWARESGGFSVELAADRLGVKVDQLVDWEADRRHPTVAQLRNIAEVYKRPLATFFLPAPPEQPKPLHDFRRLPGAGAVTLSPALLLEMRRARRRRTVALQLFAELGTAPSPFSVAAESDDDPDRIAALGRAWLNVPVKEQERWRGEYGGLNGWITALEARDVLVFHTGRVRVEEMRGFSISEPAVPVIVLNGKDAPRGRVFTLMHEFAHLMLAQGGVCDPTRVGWRGRSPDERVEVFCNRVSGSLLVPSEALVADPRVSAARGRKEWGDEVILALAQRFGVSREVVLRRLLILGRASESFYERKRAEYLAQYRERVSREAASEGFAPPSRVAVRDNGRRYTRLVLDALERERITFADVADYLGVRLKHLEDIAYTVERTAAGA